MAERKQWFESDAEVWSVVEKFERCGFHLEEFNHGRHLAVGMAYLAEGDVEQAMARMRVALQRFSAHHGKMGFHETITRFWLLRLHDIQGPSLAERASRAMVELANKDLIYEYYDKEVLTSEEAKRVWVEPQRQPLPGADSCARNEGQR